MQLSFIFISNKNGNAGLFVSPPRISAGFNSLSPQGYEALRIEVEKLTNQRIHIFGASGSGTTTIAKNISEKFGYEHFDTDNYYWYPTEMPFTEARPVDERLQLMKTDLENHDKWILSGSLDGWGDPLIPLFELVIFVYVPQSVRIERLRERELKRYGKEALSGGSRYESAKEFIEWAAGYDSGLLPGRSLLRHEKWIAGLECEVIKIINISLSESINLVINSIIDWENPHVKTKPFQRT